MGVGEVHPGFLWLPGEFVQGVAFKLIFSSVWAQQVSAGLPHPRTFLQGSVTSVLHPALAACSGEKSFCRRKRRSSANEMELQGSSFSGLCNLPNCVHVP